MASKEAKAALKNRGKSCFCGTPLTFTPRGQSVKCHCERCERRSRTIDQVIDVQGCGATEDEAHADWLEAQWRM
jgi:hypothetical protein